MKICAIICELNPYHNGHKFLFDEARKLTNCDKVLALMSGNFVQRGEPAVLDEYERAKCALICGADIVLELPTVYAVGSAQAFAEGAIKVINTIPFVTHLALGAENADTELLTQIADIQSTESPRYKEVLKRELSNGNSYAKAITTATAVESNNKNVSEILNKPNNILAVNYIKAIKKFDNKIIPLPVARICENDSNIIKSASYIRDNLHDTKAIAGSMPDIIREIFDKNTHNYPINQGILSALVLNSIRSLSAELISLSPDCNEGLEHRLKQAANNYSDYAEFIADVSNARYPTARLKRICLQQLLGFTKEMQNSGYDVCRLLGIKRTAKDILSILPKTVITKKSNESNIPSEYVKVYETEKKASSIYSLISAHKGYSFYKKMQIVD